MSSEPVSVYDVPRHIQQLKEQNEEGDYVVEDVMHQGEHAVLIDLRQEQAASSYGSSSRDSLQEDLEAMQFVEDSLNWLKDEQRGEVEQLLEAGDMAGALAIVNEYVDDMVEMHGDEEDRSSTQCSGSSLGEGQSFGSEEVADAWAQIIHTEEKAAKPTELKVEVNDFVPSTAEEFVPVDKVDEFVPNADATEFVLSAEACEFVPDFGTGFDEEPVYDGEDEEDQSVFVDRAIPAALLRSDVNRKQMTFDELMRLQPFSRKVNLPEGIVVPERPDTVMRMEMAAAETSASAAEATMVLTTPKRRKNRSKAAQRSARVNSETTIRSLKEAMNAAVADASKSNTTGSLGPKRWMPNRQKSPAAVAEMAARSVLNKLTPDNFETMVSQFKSIEITDAETLNTVAKVVYLKAIDEPEFIPMYIDLVQDVHDHLPCAGASDGEAVSFLDCLKKLLNDGFMNGPAPPPMDLSNEDQETKDEWETKISRRKKGILVLAGELFNQGFSQSEDIIVRLDNLLDRDPIDVEGACNLLNHTGAKLDESQCPALLPVVRRLKDVAGEGSLPARLRFKVEDMVSRSEDMWTPRREEKVNPRKHTATKLASSNMPIVATPADKVVTDSKGRTITLKKLGSSVSREEAARRAAWWDDAATPNSTRRKL